MCANPRFVWSSVIVVQFPTASMLPCGTKELDSAYLTCGTRNEDGWLNCNDTGLQSHPTKFAKNEKYLILLCITWSNHMDFNVLSALQMLTRNSVKQFLDDFKASYFLYIPLLLTFKQLALYTFGAQTWSSLCRCETIFWPPRYFDPGVKIS